MPCPLDRVPSAMVLVLSCVATVLVIGTDPDDCVMRDQDHHVDDLRPRTEDVSDVVVLIERIDERGVWEMGRKDPHDDFDQPSGWDNDDDNGKIG